MRAVKRKGLQSASVIRRVELKLLPRNVRRQALPDPRTRVALRQPPFSLNGPTAILDTTMAVTRRTQAAEPWGFHEGRRRRLVPP